MTDISTLLQEAKPLYFARKKRRRQLRAAGLGAACLMAAYLLPTQIGSIPQASGDMETFYAYLYEPSYMDNRLNAFQENDWEAFIPTDEYGLVAV